MTFRCRRCDADHPGPPMAYSSTAPARWYELSETELESSRLDGELCVVKGGEFFLRANLEVPVSDGPEPLVFSAWVQLSPEDLRALLARWEEPDRVGDPAYAGRLANDLPGYPDTLGLAVEVHTGEPGERSRAVPLPTEHPLSIDHWEGVDMSRVQGLAELLAHP